MEQPVYACDKAIGLTNINSTGSTVFFDGIEHAIGFPELPNILTSKMVLKKILQFVQEEIKEIFLT